MQTTLFEVKTKDGRMFRVFCANSKQRERFLIAVFGKNYAITEIVNGMHTIKQFEQIIKTLN